MSQIFQRPVLICNSQSGSYSPDLERQLSEMLDHAGRPLLKSYQLPDDDMPDLAALRALDADLLIVWTGDGTIRAAAQNTAGWDGAILPLPGGTLNLLSKSLHGDRDAPSILADVISEKATRRFIPVLTNDAGDIALITILAGPATRWAEVRETMRQDGIVSATREAPEAMDAMLNAPGVKVAGQDQDYAAVILTPLDHGIEAHGIVTDSTMDVLRHGLAWLGGDFRDGPSILLAEADHVTLESAAPISIEFDGELTECASPIRFTLGRSAVEFVSST